MERCRARLELTCLVGADAVYDQFLNIMKGELKAVDMNAFKAAANHVLAVPQTSRRRASTRRA